MPVALFQFLDNALVSARIHPGFITHLQALKYLIPSLPPSYSACPKIPCRTFCPFGYVEENECPICKCAPSPCEVSQDIEVLHSTHCIEILRNRTIYSPPLGCIMQRGRSVHSNQRALPWLHIQSSVWTRYNFFGFLIKSNKSSFWANILKQFPAPPCKPLDACSLECAYGLLVINGCPICECSRNPCDVSILFHVLFLSP